MEGIMGNQSLCCTVKEARNLIPCGNSKLYELIGNGLLDARKLGNRTLITRASIVSFVDSLPGADIGRPAKGGALKGKPTAAA